MNHVTMIKTIVLTIVSNGLIQTEKSHLSHFVKCSVLKVVLPCTYNLIQTNSETSLSKNMVDTVVII